MIGHTKTAAGMASLIKTALALEASPAAADVGRDGAEPADRFRRQPVLHQQRSPALDRSQRRRRLGGPG